MAAEFHADEIDGETVLWRFMAWWKFVSMLENRGLYFARADLLGDPFEGSRSQHNESQRDVVAKMFPQFRWEQDVNSRLKEWHREWVYINCWHANPHESAAMWQLYGDTDGTVAVQTTVSRLREVLDERCVVGLVNYIDYYKDAIANAPHEVFMHKRHDYDHEREFRAIFPDSPIERSSIGEWTKLNAQEKGPPGVWKPADFARFVDRIIMEPNPSHAFTDRLSGLLREHSVAAPVIRSGLAAMPKF